MICIAAMIALAACSTSSTRAPVIERLPGKTSVSPAAKPIEPDWRPASYTVRKGDTLYSIALEHGHDYKDLADWNGIPAPYTISIGQVLRMGPAQTETTAPLKSAPMLAPKPLPLAEPTLKTEPKAIKQAYSEQALAQLEKGESKHAPIATPKIESPKVEPPNPTATPEPQKPDTADEEKVDWGWPAEGKILTNFNDNGNKGIDIGGSLGQPVLAAAAGKVVHTGSTLRGYGKLIIIKHNKSYFSVYAHNNQVLVREGQAVVKGQKIAEMGSTDADRVKLHFEIRRLGTPVDPLKYLPNDRTP